MDIFWTLGVSGNFATTSNWKPAAVPGSADDAILDANGTYTVTSSLVETVDVLTIAKKQATLFVTGASNFTTTNGGLNDGTILVDDASEAKIGTTGENTTLTNLGNIELGSASSGTLVVAGNVSLAGSGKVILSDNSANLITGNGTPATLYIHNSISGAGKIGGSPGFALVNERGGIVDATGISHLTIESGTLVENSGILESTNPKGLSDPGGLLLEFSTIDNTPLGIIEAHGANTHVLLFNETVVGGTLETRGTNADIETAPSGVATLDGTQAGNPVNNDGHVVVTAASSLELAGTINNTSVITAASEDGQSAWIIVEGKVTLEGGGHVTLTNTGPNPPVSAVFGGVLTNVDNVISGTGMIGEQSQSPVPEVGVFINEAKGIIDANASTPLIVTGGSPDTNAGLMEATHGGTLLIENVTIDNHLGMARGTVEADRDSAVGLENATIAGGFVTIEHGATIEAEEGSNKITGALVTNAGTIGADGSNLTIIGDVTNKGTLDANNATLAIDGTVCGGEATLEGTGEIEFGGASSARVIFAANADAILKLDKPSAFTGTISGLTSGDYIDLTNINFADNPTIDYSSKTHTLTVTDSVSHVTDTIRFKEVGGTFSAESDGSGGTFITDTPTAKMVAYWHDQDTFMFATNFGESRIADVSTHGDSIVPPKSGCADLAAFLAQALQHWAIPTDHDATDILHNVEALIGRHAHDFLV